MKTLVRRNGLSFKGNRGARVAEYVGPVVEVAKNVADEALAFLRSKAFAFLCGCLALCLGNYCSAQVTLPSTGIDIPDYVTAAMDAMATVMAAVIGAFIAWMIVRKGMYQVRKAI